MKFSQDYISKLRFKLHFRHTNNFCGWGGGRGDGGVVVFAMCAVVVIVLCYCVY
jgi:hypothetical protein